MDISSLANSYVDMLKTDSSQTASKLQQTSKKDYSKATDDELMSACKEFEAYFLEQIYKGMEKTIMKADEEENDYVSAFSDMRIEEYAKLATNQGDGIGLAKQLYESMKRNMIS